MFVSFRDSFTSEAITAVQPLRPLVAMLFLFFVLLGSAAELDSWAAAASRAENFSSIPAGTILPIRLDKPISVKDTRPDQAIEASIMQDVPLPSGKIPMKTKAMGTVISVVKDADGTGAQLTFQFTYLEDKKERVPILAFLRAMASFQQVLSAQMANTGGTDTGSPASWSTTILVGGDVRFGDGGKVTHDKENVGKGVTGGVLVHISANPALGCEGPNGADTLQALWVFSSNACGVYGKKKVKIAHAGKGEPVGQITLHFENDDMKLEPGTGFLLRIAPKP